MFKTPQTFAFHGPLYSGLGMVGAVHSPSSSSSQSSGCKYKKPTEIKKNYSIPGIKYKTYKQISTGYLLGIRISYLFWNVIIALQLLVIEFIDCHLLPFSTYGTDKSLEKIYKGYLWLLILRIINEFLVIPIFRL